MIDIISPRCIHKDCKTRASCNLDGQKKAIYCSSHKLDGMIDIISPRCIHKDCKTRASCNLEGQKKAIYCSSHKLDGMIDIINRRCIIENCKTIPYFNLEGQKKAIYCSSHKLDGMIDIISPRCIHKDCKTRASCNLEGQKKAIYCSSHKLDGMIDIISRRCKTFMCSTMIKKKYDGYCLFCYINVFPERPVSRNYKTKEYSVVNFVKKEFPFVEWKNDKTIIDGCSKKRPDLLIDLGYQVIIIEIDENQHTNYDGICENKRLMEISQDIGHRPIIFIRFNPDNYIKNNKKITSCWCTNKNGINVIKKSKKNEWEQRLNILHEQIKYWLNPINTINKTIEVIQLFYDQ